mmetsp:Transcript_11573/g.31369  ORF Transcript_11573/g.31369 Transcript_11573/m.31369 type:complete len:205 (+) Transcript_11573:730-1344(+)
MPVNDWSIEPRAPRHPGGLRPCASPAATIGSVVPKSNRINLDAVNSTEEATATTAGCCPDRAVRKTRTNSEALALSWLTNWPSCPKMFCTSASEPPGGAGAGPTPGRAARSARSWRRERPSAHPGSNAPHDSKASGSSSAAGPPALSSVCPVTAADWERHRGAPASKAAATAAAHAGKLFVGIALKRGRIAASMPRGSGTTSER